MFASFRFYLIERINSERERAQAEVKKAGDIMAGTLAAQRQASEDALEMRNKSQLELEEAQRLLEQTEQKARSVYEEICRAEGLDPSEMKPGEADFLANVGKLKPGTARAAGVGPADDDLDDSGLEDVEIPEGM